MSDDHETIRDDDSSSTTPDPLGIIGWVIGGKYQVDSYIGGGGFGEVYAGHNQHLVEQRVVIKFFKRVQSRERFDKEARILCQLDHPNISRVIDYLPDEGAVVVAFIDGQDGGKILKERGTLPEKLYLNVARSMTKAIAYAHARKIAHRDIKPGNILIDKNEHVYLIDFGIAKEIGGEATKTAYTALTPMFAAPERQSGGKDYNPFLSDIYEMGITLFNFATNSLPYRNPVNPNFGEWGGQAAKVLSPELRRILLKATHPDPEKRFRSAADMAADLEELKNAYGGGRKFPAKLAVAAALAIIIGYAGWQYGGDLLSEVTSSPPGQEESVSTEPVSPPKDDTRSTTGVPETTTPAAAIPGADKKTTETIVAETPTDSPTQAEDKEVASIPEKENRPQPPPLPPMSHLLIRFAPADNLVLRVDGNVWPPGARRDIAPGRHEITAMHPDYPFHRRTVDLASGDQEMSIDLIREYGDLVPIDMQLALSPPSDRQILELSFNGRKRTWTDFPVLDLRQPEGQWQVDASLRPLGGDTAGTARIDSCVIFPYGGGPRQKMRGASGIISLGGTAGGEKITSIPMVIYWSEKK